ncbi:MAG: CHAT domain-containing protein, partial [Rhizonema sp. PD38]|nr:CHAT domain-containing protein [Rhizonema sp. PD38]
MKNQKKQKQIAQILPLWTSRAVAIFFSLVLLSESTVANVGGYGLKIAQQTVSAPSVPLSPDKQQRYQEEVKLYQEAQQLEKKGTKEGYQQALEKYQQALKIVQEIKLRAEQAKILMNIGVVNFLLSEYQQALELDKQALTIWQELNQPLFEANVLSMIGDVYSTMGKPQEALEYLKRAESSFRKQNQFAFIAITLSYTSRAYLRLGDMKNALNSLNQALEIYRNTLKYPEKEAQTLNSLAFLYSQMGKSEIAFEYYNQALKIYRERKDLLGQAEILRNIGSLHSTLGEHDLALQYLNKALDIQSTKDTLVNRALTIKEIAYVYGSRGDYKKEIDHYQKAKLLFHEAGSTSLESLMIGSIISIYRNFLGNNQKALEYTEEVLKLNRKAGDNDYYKAFEAANRALELSKQHTDSFLETASLEIIGSIYLVKQDSKNALNSYNKAFKIYNKAELKIQQAETLNKISIAYEFEKEYQQAINTLNEELKLRQTLKDSTGEAQALYNIAINQRKLGNLEAALLNIEEAIKIVENIRGNVKSQDLRTSYFATVQSYYKFKINLLMELDKKSPSKGYDAQAIETSEASRARGLVELLTEARANIRKGSNPELLAEESRLQALIDGKEKVRFEIVNSDKIKNPTFKKNADKLQTEIDELLSQQKQLETKIRSSSSKYAKIKYPQPLTLRQIQQQLDKDTLLLQYSLGSDRSFLWVVSPNSLNTYSLPKKSEIDKSAINLFCLVSQNSSKPPSATNKENPCADIKTRRIDEAAEELSKLVLAPVKDKLAKKRLVIVADGALQYIPFAALADLNYPPAQHSKSSTNSETPPNQKDISCTKTGSIRICQDNDSPQNKFDYQPLFINHEIVNLPSASTIAIQRQELATRSSAGKKTLAILADPVYSANDERFNSTRSKQLNKQQNQQDFLSIELERSTLKRSADILNRQGWKRLPGTRKEADAILNVFTSIPVPDSNSLQVFDFDANYNWATSSALNKFRILHFATHGFVNDVNPELSGIVLSLVDKQGKDIRGYLRLGDLFNLDYPADLIVLSACETGLGKEIQGEGLVGLTRGLMYAGAERLVVSLWQVDDKGTAEFMQEFYKQMLHSDKPANEALRATQL